MKQAKVLNKRELNRVLAVVAAGNHAERNRLAVMLSVLAGLQVGEIAHLLVGDLVLDDGSIADQVVLNPAYTKGAEHRTVFVIVSLRYPVEYTLTPCPIFQDHLTSPHATNYTLAEMLLMSTYN